MSSYDVVVIGAGAAGLTAAALLAREGKRVLIVEREGYLGGRAVELPDEGFKINLGGHLVEDGGSGLTKVFEHVGKTLVHGEVSTEMPVWDHEAGKWGSIRERYAGSKSELKKGHRRHYGNAVRGVRCLGRPASVPVAGPVHRPSGRLRPVRVRLGA